MPYSIIIPIYNEIKSLEGLLLELEFYYKLNHEIIIIDDGSTDGSDKILQKSSFINNIRLENNSGKGIALRKGILSARNEKIIIYDGDLELETKDISKFMNLDRKNKIYSIMGFRFKHLGLIRSEVDWGNFIFTTFFNLLYRSCHKDILCCAKSFYRKDIPIKELKSIGFDIDVEISSYLTLNNRGKYIPQIFLHYNRRSLLEGKKLKISDGWVILKRILLSL